MKHLKFGLFLAIFALVLVGCEKTDPVTQNTTTKTEKAKIGKAYLYVHNWSVKYLVETEIKVKNTDYYYFFEMWPQSRLESALITLSKDFVDKNVSITLYVKELNERGDVIRTTRTYTYDSFYIEDGAAYKVSIDLWGETEGIVLAQESNNDDLR